MLARTTATPNHRFEQRVAKTSRVRPALHTRSRRAVVVCSSSADYEVLQGKTVVKAATGDVVDIMSLWTPEPGTKVVLPFLTHFADLSSWELAQRLARVMPTLQASGVAVFAVGLGSMDNAKAFSRLLRFPLDKLYADPSGECYRALGFSPGLAPDLPVSPYAKLLPMLAGIGSPGTVQEVLRGYLGDRDAKPVFDSPTPFDAMGTGYQRPLELATLRMFNLLGILPQWSELCPPNLDLLTQQGGCVAFDGASTLFKHVDSGILKYTDVDAMLRAVLQAEVVSEPPRDAASRYYNMS